MDGSIAESLNIKVESPVHKSELQTEIFKGKKRTIIKDEETLPSHVHKRVRVKEEVLRDKATDADQAGPFPNLCRPSPEECRAVRDALAALHGEPRRAQLGEPKHEAGTAAAIANSLHTHTQQTVLDSLVRTILSQNTTDHTSHRAFASLKQAFPTWQSVLDAPAGTVEEAIRVGGLADIKAERIKAILATLLQERGSICLEHLREMQDEAIKVELTRFKGVGKKTVACVLMFCLGREEFPVDTHVWRLSKALGWVPAKASRDDTYAHLNHRVPPDVRYDLHVLMVEHGKRCARCAKRTRSGLIEDCPLRTLPAQK